jgi:hypothetical protein
MTEFFIFTHISSVCGFYIYIITNRYNQFNFLATNVECRERTTTVKAVWPTFVAAKNTDRTLWGEKKTEFNVDTTTTYSGSLVCFLVPKKTLNMNGLAPTQLTN